MFVSLVTYCQWDYLTLPTHARQYYAALRQAGVPSEIIFVPHESHISEMVSVPSESDFTAKSILNFIRQQ